MKIKRLTKLCMAYYETWHTWHKQCHKHSTFLWLFSPMIPSSNFDYSGGSTNSSGNKSSSKTTSSSKQLKKYALFRLPLKAKDALGTSLQVKIIFLVKVIITQKTKTLIFHRVKIPAKQNTEAVLRVALQERCSANMHQISRRAPMKICDFSKVAMQLY